jgi:hypothetical protein
MILVSTLRENFQGRSLGSKLKRIKNFEHIQT